MQRWLTCSRGGWEVALSTVCRDLSSMQLPQDTSEENWKNIFATNVDGVFHTVRAAYPLLKRSKQGKVVITSSIGGKRAVFWARLGVCCSVLRPAIPKDPTHDMCLTLQCAATQRAGLHLGSIVASCMSSAGAISAGGQSCGGLFLHALVLQACGGMASSQPTARPRVP